MRNLLGGVALAVLLVAACGEDGNKATPGGAGDAAAGADPGPSTGEGGSGGDAEPGSAGSGMTSAGTSPGGTPSEGAAGADAGSGGQGSEPVSTVVHGKVYAGADPLPGVVVDVDGEKALTDDNGEFTATDVAATYQLVLISEDYKQVKVVDGLTTREPIVNLGAVLPLTSSSQLSGKLSGGAGVPVPADHTTSVVFAADVGWVGGYDSVGPAQSNYTLGPVTWALGASVSGVLSALQWKEGANGAESFTGFASKPFTLQDGQVHGAIDGSVPATNLALTDPAEVTLDGTLTLPVGMHVHQADQIVGNHGISLDLGPGAFSFVAPELDVPQFLNIIILDANQAAQTTFVSQRPASGDWSIDVPKPPNAILPLEGATNVTTATEFSWTALPAGTVAQVWWDIGEWRVYRVTPATKTTLPDLSPYGLVLEPGASDSWVATGWGPAETPDEMIAFEHLYSTTIDYVASTLLYAEYRSFSLAP